MNRSRRAGSFAGKGLALLGILVLAAGFAGCADDEPAECKRTETGTFIIDTDPNIQEQTYAFTARVTAAQFFSSPPPLWDYRLRTDEGEAIQIQVKDPAFGFPVEVDSTYDFVIERHLAGNIVPSNGVKIFDRDGLRYMAVYDWLPNDSIFSDGYGDLDGDGELQVFFQQAGCSPREENSARFKELTNYRLEFLIGNDLRTLLWHGEQAHLGRWIIDVEKAILIQVKSTEYAQNQISFFVQRDDTVQ